MEEKIKKIAFFIDGTFFLKINSYFRYHHERKSTISFGGLWEFVRDEFSKLESLDKRYCQVVDSHWFRGRYSTNQLERKYTENMHLRAYITNERKLDDMFMYSNMIPHYYPLLVDSLTGEALEDGIKVKFALEAYDLTVQNHYDVVVLIAGDSAYVPLIRKLNSMGTRVMVLGWDFSYSSTTSGGKDYTMTTRTSQALIDECTYPIMMDNRIDDRTSKNNPLINSLFSESITQKRTQSLVPGQ
jgi:uncharacterized LabA/DUF88 family protein